ncbi:MAG: hypothetical protein HYR89_01890 [Actinobacteria bacterium]|nr:hypothetical protein [Actinomycetota bacterium]MBI3257719.1 hypothetical protein [Actinomycetota bacterium]
MASFEPETVIDCIDCGGPCGLLTIAPELGWQPGDLVTYRCRDCLDRWDLLIPGGDETAFDLTT